MSHNDKLLAELAQETQTKPSTGLFVLWYILIGFFYLGLILIVWLMMQDGWLM